MKTARFLTAALLVTGVLTGCSSGSGDHNVPLSWMRKEYPTRVAAGYADPSDRPSEVADEIHDHTSAKDRTRDAQGRVFLRYRDDIVAISPYGLGSRIEVDNYRSGYRRWNSSLYDSWPDPDSESFRGGGPGSGK